MGFVGSDEVVGWFEWVWRGVIVVYGEEGGIIVGGCWVGDVVGVLCCWVGVCSDNRELEVLSYDWV